MTHDSLSHISRSNVADVLFFDNNRQGSPSIQFALSTSGKTYQIIFNRAGVSLYDVDEAEVVWSK